MWSFWISDSWQRSHTRSILWINQLPKSNTSLHIELKASHIKSFSAGCGTHWPRGEKGVGYAGYDAINVRSQHGLDCMDWLGPCPRVGENFHYQPVVAGAGSSAASSGGSVPQRPDTDIQRQYCEHRRGLTCSGQIWSLWMKWMNRGEKICKEYWYWSVAKPREVKFST